MEKQLDSILLQYKTLTVLEDKPLGISGGCAGKMIVNGLLYRYSGDSIFQENALQLLGHIIGNIGSSNSVAFGDGIAGIGWAVEWMVQQRIFELDTHDLLEDVDGILYNLVVFGDEQPVAVLDGLLGRIIYFRRRLSHINRQPSRFRDLVHRECMVILTDAIRFFLLEKDAGWLSPQLSNTNEQLRDLADVLIICSHPEVRNINRVSIDIMLTAIIHHAMAIMLQLDLSAATATALCSVSRLAYAGMTAARYRKDNTGETIFRQYFQLMSDASGSHGIKMYDRISSDDNSTAPAYLHPQVVAALREAQYKSSEGPGIDNSDTHAVRLLSLAAPGLTDWEELLVFN